MKKTFAALLLVAMLVSSVIAIPANAMLTTAAAPNTDATLLVAANTADPLKLESVGFVCAKNEAITLDENGKLTDGDTGNNKTSQFDGKWSVTDCFVKAAKGETISYGETVTGTTYTYDADLKTTADVAATTVKLSDGTTYTYWYGLKATLAEAATIGGVKIYMHGYKPGVLDMNFAILVSADGETWTKVKEAKDLVGKDGLLTAEGQKEYVGAVNTVGAAAADTDAAACISWEGNGIENVKYVMYVSDRTRYNNAYYTMRFTEFQVFEGVVEVPVIDDPAPAPDTGDTTVVFIALGSVALISAAVVIRKKREN